MTPTFDTLFLFTPAGIYPFPEHYLLPSAQSSAELAKMYGGTPFLCKDPQLQYMGQGCAPNRNWWLKMVDTSTGADFGVDCYSLAGYWKRNAAHPETAEKYCQDYVIAMKQIKNPMPPL